MISRRAFLVLSGAALATAARAQLDPNRVALRKAAMDEAVRRVTGGALVRPGRVRLELPPLIDNGNAVPMSVSVESPMTASDHVTSIHVFTEKNPQPNVIGVYLGPRAGRARFATRIRVADSQTVHAIARLADGSFWSDSVDVVVTLSACLEEGLI